MIIDLERILFVLSTIVGVTFWLIGLYISKIIQWNWKTNKSNKNTGDCVDTIIKNFKWNTKDKTMDSAIDKLDIIPLVYFLMIGCMTIGSVLILNSLFSINDILILVPLVNKIFIGSLFIGIVLVIVYLFEFVKFLNNTDEKSKGNENKCKDTLELKLDLKALSKDLNVSIGIIAGVVGVLFILIVAPTVMAQTGRKK